MTKKPYYDDPLRIDTNTLASDPLESTDFILKYIITCYCVCSHKEKSHNVVDKEMTDEDRKWMEENNYVYGSVRFVKVTDCNECDCEQYVQDRVEKKKNDYYNDDELTIYDPGIDLSLFGDDKNE